MDEQHRRYRTPEEALRSVELAAEGAHERAARTTAWKDEVLAVRGRGSALGGGVTVEVDLDGSLVTLAVRDDAARHGGRSVAHAILEAQARAHEQVRERTAELNEATFGASSPITRAVQAEVDDLNPTTVPDPDGPTDLGPDPGRRGPTAPGGTPDGGGTW